MAKGSFLGVKRGKLGGVVGYIVTNSKNKEKQGWRVYQPIVSNPQTEHQIDQRVKLTAVNNLYRALKPIITRGFENMNYGDAARREYLRLALSTDFSRGPILPKGSTFAPPIPGVPVMYGSLAPISPQYSADADDFVLNGLTIITAGGLVSVGDISRVFVDNGYKVGDQVTMIFGWSVLQAELAMAYKTVDFILDPTDLRSFETVFGVRFKEIGDVLAIDSYDAWFSAATSCMCISVSRNGDGSHLRSYAEFAFGATFDSMYYNLSSTQVAERRATYRKAAAASNNWEQVPEGADAVTFFLRSGAEVSLVRVRQDGDWLKAVDEDGVTYYIWVRAIDSLSTNEFLTSYSTVTATGPTDGNPSNSIDAYATNNKQLNMRAWLLLQGVSASVLPAYE